MTASHSSINPNSAKCILLDQNSKLLLKPVWWKYKIQLFR